MPPSNDPSNFNFTSAAAQCSTSGTISLFTLLVLGVATTIGSCLATRVALGQEIKLLASDGTANDNFGQSVALANGRALVGAPGHRHANSPIFGAAYLIDISTGTELFELTAAASGNFGGAVGLSADYMVIGASNEEDAMSGEPRGAAYFYRADTGALIGRASGMARPEYYDFFGSEVAIEGSIAAISAPGSLNPDGRVDLYDASTATLLRSLQPDDVSDSLGFGIALDIDNGLVIVGDPNSQEFGIDTGSAYVFDAQTGDQIAKMLSPDAAGDRFFGLNVALEDGLALIDAQPGSGPDQASVYLYDAIGGELLRELVADDDQVSQFGTDIDLSNGYAFVGGTTIVDGVSEEAIYVFSAATGLQVSRILASDGVAGDSFAYSIAADGGMLLAGAPGQDDLGNNSGAAYLITTVPEPASAGLLVLAGTLVLVGARRYRSGR